MAKHARAVKEEDSLRTGPGRTPTARLRRKKLREPAESTHRMIFLLLSMNNRTKETRPGSQAHSWANEAAMNRTSSGLPTVQAGEKGAAREFFKPELSQTLPSGGHSRIRGRSPSPNRTAAHQRQGCPPTGQRHESLHVLFLGKLPTASVSADSATVGSASSSLALP